MSQLRRPECQALLNAASEFFPYAAAYDGLAPLRKAETRSIVGRARKLDLEEGGEGFGLSSWPEGLGPTRTIDFARHRLRTTCV
jgi:hypothetical protein